MFKIEVNNVDSIIRGTLPDEVVNDLESKLSFPIEGAFFSKLYQKGLWDGRTHLYRKKTQIFPTGLIHYVRDSFDKHQVPYQIENKRNMLSSGNSIPLYDVLPRDYQEDSVEKAIARQRGIVRIATGGGKTVVIAGIMARLNVPTLVLIHKLDIYWQLIERFEKYLRVPIGRIGAGEVDIQPFTVGMIQSIAYCFNKKTKLEGNKPVSKPDIVKDYISKVSCLLVDECHHLSAPTLVEIHKKAKSAVWRVGFSATPFRDDGQDLLIEASTAGRFVDLSASYLIDRGFLAQPTFSLLKCPHKPQPAGIKYVSLYKKEIVENDMRNRLITQAVAMAASKGQTILVAVSRIDHGRILEHMIKQVVPKTVFIYGGSDRDVRRDVLKNLDNRRLSCVIATTVFGEGIDIASLNCLVDAKAGESSVDALQLAGRALRKTPTKNKAAIVSIFDIGCRWFEKHSWNRLKTYKTEPRYEIQWKDAVDDSMFPS